MLLSVTLYIFALVAVPLNAIPQYQGGWHSWSSTTSDIETAIQTGSPITPAGSVTPTAIGTNSVTQPTSSGTTAPSTHSSIPGSSGDIGLSSSCFRPNGIPVGWLPDGVSITSIESQVSPEGPCTYGNYAQITSTSSMPDDQIQANAAEAAKAGAVYTIALQPWIPFSEVNAQSVASSMEKLTAITGSIVWLRLAHEVNWYIDTNPLNTDSTNKYHGTNAEFKAMWTVKEPQTDWWKMCLYRCLSTGFGSSTAVAKAVDRSKVKMFWSPVGPFQPGDTIQTLKDDWYPGDSVTDIVGLDAYGQQVSGSPTSTFNSALGAFCDIYKNKPLHLGETGWLQGGTPAQKQYWLEQVSGTSALARCPNYQGFTWFEYLKDGDYRIVTGSGGDIAKTVLG